MSSSFHFSHCSTLDQLIWNNQCGCTLEHEQSKVHGGKVGWGITGHVSGWGREKVGGKLKIVTKGGEFYHLIPI